MEVGGEYPGTCVPAENLSSPGRRPRPPLTTCGKGLVGRGRILLFMSVQILPPSAPRVGELDEEGQ